MPPLTCLPTPVPRSACTRRRAGFLLVAAVAGAAACAPTVDSGGSGSEPAPGPAAGGAAARGPGGLDARVELLREQMGVPGVVVMVVLGDSLAFERSYGLADPEAGTPMTPDVVLHAGELIALVNGLAAARLEREDRVTLDAPIGTYVPGLLDPVGEVTLGQLLTHTAGLSRIFVRGPAERDDLEFAARWLTPLDIVAPPGEFLSTTLTGPVLAGHALERAGGAGYARVLERAVFEPLGMTRSTVDRGRAAELGLAPGLGYPGDTPTAELARVDAVADSAVQAPRLGLYATAADLARLAAAVLSDGIVDGQRRLPDGVAAAVLEARATPPWSSAPEPPRYGYGTRFVQWEGTRELRASARSRGHTVHLRLLPEQRVGVIVAANAAGSAATPLFNLSDFVLRSVLELPDRRAAARRAGGSRAPTPTPVELADPDALTGTYRNGTESIVIDRGGQGLVLVSGTMRLDLTLESDRALRARIPDGRVAMVIRLLQDSAGELYLYYDGRVFRRVEDAAG